MKKSKRPPTIPANTFVDQGRLPKGWRLGSFWSNSRDFGWWVIREEDGYTVKIVDHPGTKYGIRQALWICLANGILKRRKKKYGE